MPICLFTEKVRHQIYISFWLFNLSIYGIKADENIKILAFYAHFIVPFLIYVSSQLYTLGVKLLLHTEQQKNHGLNIILLSIYCQGLIEAFSIINPTINFHVSTQVRFFLGSKLYCFLCFPMACKYYIFKDPGLIANRKCPAYQQAHK